MGSIFRGICHAKCRPIDTVERQASPGVLPCALVAPLLSAQLEDLLQRFGTNSRPRFSNRAGDNRCSRPRQNQIQLSHQVGNWPFPKHGHANHQPHHLLGRKPSLSYRGGSSRRQRLGYPCRVNVLSDALELLGRRECAYRLEGTIQMHDLLHRRSMHGDFASCLKARHEVIHRNSRSISITYALTDRHCP